MWIGLDVGEVSTSVCALDQTGQPVLECCSGSTVSEIAECLAPIPLANISENRMQRLDAPTPSHVLLSVSSIDCLMTCALMAIAEASGFRLQEPAMPEPVDRILRLPAVLDRTGLSRSTLYRKIQNGTFPKQIAISTRCAGWRESAVNAWLRNPRCYSADEYPSG